MQSQLDGIEKDSSSISPNSSQSSHEHGFTQYGFTIHDNDDTSTTSKGSNKPDHDSVTQPCPPLRLAHHYWTVVKAKNRHKANSSKPPSILSTRQGYKTLMSSNGIGGECRSFQVGPIQSKPKTHNSFALLQDDDTVSNSISTGIHF